MNRSVLPLLAFVVLAGATQAHAACPNASTTVTVPLSGTNSVVMYDQACNVLPGGNFNVLDADKPGAPQVTASTSPNVTADAAGLHFGAGSAVVGAIGHFKMIYVPNGLQTVMSYVVGGPITGITAGTSTP